MSLFTIISIVAAIIIIALASYATHLLLLLRKQQQQKQQEIAAQNTKHLKSIKIIVEAMIQEQCEISEGCWRLSVLMGNLQIPDYSFEQEFPAIFRLYNLIKHMPIMEARKALEKKERMKLDFERMKHEAELQDEVKANVAALQLKTQELLDSVPS